MAIVIKLDKDTGISVDITNYRGMIGSLLYLTASRPDIMYATCLCARFQADPREPHLTAVKRILKYLKGTADLGLWYPRESDFKLIGNPVQHSMTKHISIRYHFIREHVMEDAYSYCLETKFIDDRLLTEVKNIDGAKQVALLTDGMDTRPYRFNWPKSTIVFDISPGNIFK
ncbi:hypothetical protein AgCh_032722 [Apium graveolens]